VLTPGGGRAGDPLDLVDIEHQVPADLAIAPPAVLELRDVTGRPLPPENRAPPPPSLAGPPDEEPLALEDVPPSTPPPSAADPAFDPSPIPPPTPGQRPACCRECGRPIATPEAACRACTQGTPPPSLRARIRNSPGLRLGIGLALSLGVGRLLTLPYERHADRAVTALETESVRLQVRLDPRLAARGAALADEAHAEATSVAVRVAVIWLLLAAGAMALWLFVL